MFGLNTVDLLIILTLIIYVILHVGEGFLALSQRLIAFFGAIVFAFLTYDWVSEFLSGYVSWSPGIIDAGSFLLMFVILQVSFSFVLDLVVERFPTSIQRSTVSKVLAVIPASIDGLLLISLGLLLLVITPVLPEVKKPIEESHVGSSLVNRVAGIETYVNRVFGPATQETLGFLTIKPGEGDSIKLPFSAGKLAVDENSEMKMLDLLNEERSKVGAGPLVMDMAIVEVARAHSRDMWDRSYFAHINLDGDTPFDRMDSGGVKYNAAGENLALARTVERAHVGLMNSPGHKRNILDPAFKRVGIGVIDGGIYGKMFTQNFAD